MPDPTIVPEPLIDQCRRALPGADWLVSADGRTVECWGAVLSIIVRIESGEAVCNVIAPDVGGALLDDLPDRLRVVRDALTVALGD